jgi:chemotaxis protein methyltransferase CheR
MTSSRPEIIELRLLLEAIYQAYGYDFRNYSLAHLKRRVEQRILLSGFSSISHLQHEVLHNPDFLPVLLQDLSINVSEMFRDPSFYGCLRHEVLPLLATYPSIRIWHAGCAAGQEAYSMAILLHEAELLDRSTLFVTDFNPRLIALAQEGRYPLTAIRKYTANYQAAHGRNSFADYYTVRGQYAEMAPFLRQCMVFSEHNLATDGVFGEMHLIVCRNVLIYFDSQLQNRVVGLFWESLCPGGILCLGSKETLRFTQYAPTFEPLVERERIYRKRREALP